jgi:hypothetical protein
MIGLDGPSTVRWPARAKPYYWLDIQIRNALDRQS